jgi:hypothetical protein
MGTILSLEERRWPIEAAAIPFPRPDRTPPVTMMYLVGIFIDDVDEAIFWGEIIRIPVFSQGIKSPSQFYIRNGLDPLTKAGKIKGGADLDAMKTREPPEKKKYS